MNILCTLVVLLPLVTFPAFASVIYNNDTPNGLIGVSTNPSGGGRIEHEAGDDFILNLSTLITGGTFTGLMPTGATILNVVVEIYRVFPTDSTNPPDGKVPTRVNSPSDNAFDSLLLYLALYAGFACLAAFHPEQMAKRPFGGVNVAIWYGMTLIVSPLLLATIYLLMCWRRKQS